MPYIPNIPIRPIRRATKADVQSIRCKPIPRATPQAVSIRNVIAAQPKRTRQVPSIVDRVKAEQYEPPPPAPTAIDRLRNTGAGRILVIIGNGPSHGEIDLPKLKSSQIIDLMSINKPDDRVWPTKYWTFCDDKMRERWAKYWDEFTDGILFNTNIIKKFKQNSIVLTSIPGQGFSINLRDGIYVGRSTVYASMQIGLWLGHERIYIVGCDMATDRSGKLYPWGHNPDVKDEERVRRFRGESLHYNWAAKNLSSTIRSKYVFCSSYNKFEFLNDFTHLPHENCIDAILLAAQNLQLNSANLPSLSALGEA